MPRTNRLPMVLALVCVAYLVVSVIGAARRPIDGDEGYYALATRLVSEGQAPYVDFFYPQAPLVPYWYAPVVAVAGPHLLAMRVYSALIGALGVILWAVWLGRAYRERPLVALAGLLVVAASGGLLSWNITAKSYALANLGATAGLVSYGVALSSPRRRWWLLAGGAAFGLATSARLLYAPLALVPAIACLVGVGGPPARRRWRTAAAWVGGLAAGLAPIWVMLLRDADRFWFDNVSYHVRRFSETGALDWQGRAGAAATRFGRALIADPTLALALVVGAWAVVSWRRADRAHAKHIGFERVAAIGCVVHVLAHCLPNPVHEQYFTATLAPLLVPLVAGGLSRLRLAWARVAPACVAVALPLLAAYALLRPLDPVSGDDVWRWNNYRAACARVQALSRPDDHVFAFWPGYVFESGRQPVAGMENHFAIGIARDLTPAQRQRYRIIDLDDVIQGLDRRDASLVVVGGWMHEVNNALPQAQSIRFNRALGANYELRETMGSLYFHVRRDGGAR